jgi:cullin-4
MPSISRPSNLRQETPTSPDSRKRKRAQQQQQQQEAALERQQKQHTLPAVLAGVGRQQTNSPTNKRSKQSPTTSPSRTTPLPKQLGTNDMYNFSSTRQSGNTAIDLTASSPPTTPQPRRINGSLSRPPGRGGINSATGAKKLVVKNLKTNTHNGTAKHISRRSGDSWTPR